MTRTAAGPPDEFVAFVERRAPGLRAAAHSLSGNDRLVESFVDDLLGAVAARWRWLGFTERRLGRVGAADAFLDRIFRREATAWGRTGYDGEPDRPALGSWHGPALTASAAAELAAQVWDRSGGLRRHRWLIAAGIAGVIVLGLCAAPRGRTPPEVAPPPAPTALPPLVDVVPPFADQLGLPLRNTALPAAVELDRSRSAGLLSAARIRRALAISQSVGSPPMVLGEDGRVWQMDQDLVADVWPTPNQPVPPLTTTSLAPDGTRAAFVGNDVVTIVDLATAAAHPYPALAVTTSVAWLTADTLLVSGPNGSLLLDPRTGVTVPTLLEAADTLTIQGAPAPPGPELGSPTRPAGTPTAGAGTFTPGASTPPSSAGASPGVPPALTDRVVALLSVGEPATAPARIRRYPGGNATDTVITGDRISWLGPWRSPGFLYAGPSGRAVRDCDANSLRLPERYGRAALAAAVVNPANATVQRALVAPVGAGTAGFGAALVVGWLDRDTALVRTGDGREQHLLAWRVTDGELRLVAVLSRDSSLSVSDVTPQS